ncbi:ribosomal RNA processing protein 1 [Phytophthora cinnamomi]|uniref:ribosomal RNA processing protein 1 n=1 Tax=Phytophthora cinnamomi TaxID=4785 RepID=UPI00355A8D62|nr:ribosomal RNA processing protein 1 [Phytophthora cinnamomi]
MENAASRFGQQLAHTEKKRRDRALKKLRAYVSRKASWSALEWDKLWKALFYCMWMSDKRPVQQELAASLASLLHALPSADAALQFAHAFFRTMHREWHGLDGLRLDKFYALVRAFVRESVALLRAQRWDRRLLQRLVTILSTEVASQLPNGLRMHLADLYLAEIHGAAGEAVTTEAFVTLLEPFFALLGGEYDKTVFRRVRELVFEDMLLTYKFGPQAEKESEEEETDEEEQEQEEQKVFELVDVAQVQHRIFALASADDTAERNRAALYTLYKKFFAVTHVDSFQAAQEEAAKKEEEKKEEEAEPAVNEEEAGEKKKTKRNKKRKAKKEAEVEAETETEPEPETKAKKAEAGKEEPGKKKNKKQKVAADTKGEDVDMTPAETDKATEKKQKKQKKEEKKPKQEKKSVEKAPVEPVKEKSPAKEQAKPKQEKVEKKKENYTTVTKSGKKFKRCGSCGGFGKGLVPKDKTLCGHCERTQKTQKKKAASASKKRKAESQAQAAREEQEKSESSKKVTFGKSKALRHEVSVKRLKASAKRDAVSKDSEDIKGVLKVKSPSPVASKKAKKSKPTKGRKTAADFF